MRPALRASKRRCDSRGSPHFVGCDVQLIAMQGKGDIAAVVGAQYLRAAARQAFQRRFPRQIAAAGGAAHQRHARAHLIEKRFARAVGAAVMRHLEHVRGRGGIALIGAGKVARIENRVGPKADGRGTSGSSLASCPERMCSRTGHSTDMLVVL